MLVLTTGVEAASRSWLLWQKAVVRLLRAEFDDVMQHLSLDEVDWESWRAFYEEGRTPKAAIDRALERDF